MLRDSFLDLIPALCFHIHGWEDGSLCQCIRFGLCGEAAVKRQDFEWNDRRFAMPIQNIFTLALRTDDCEICGRVFRNIFQRDQFRFFLRFPANSKCDVLCRAIWVRTIKRRKSKTIFCNGVFQFLPVSSVINAYDTSPSRCLGSAIHPR